MIIILASDFDYSTKDANGVRQPKQIEDKNSIITTLKKALPQCGKAVFVANWPTDYETNSNRANAFFASLQKTGLHFQQQILLDDRNKHNAQAILKDADLIFLTGGRIFSAMSFYQSIQLKQALQNFQGVVFGVSAGAMMLCKELFNFPETERDLFDAEFLPGLNLVDEFILFPHFNGATQTYLGNATRDVVNDSLLPFSHHKKMIGLDNDSYIVISKNQTRLFGNAYQISGGRVTPTKLETAKHNDAHK